MNINKDIVPSNLEQALDILYSSLNTDEIALLQTVTPSWHFGTGLWLRNNWSLWEKDTPIVLWFKERGIVHADDMSAIILDALLAKVRDTDFDIDQQVRKYRQYWEGLGLNPDTLEEK